MTTEQCKTFLQLLDDYLDKTLEPERQAEIERHLEQCARCRHELEAHQRIIASLKQLEKKSAPVTLHPEVMACLQGRAASIPWGSRIQSLFSPRRLRIAMEIAAVFIVVFIGWQIFNSSSLQVTLRDRKATTPGEARYLGTALETERAVPLSSVPATLGETVSIVEAEVSKETKEEEAAFEFTTTEPPEKTELKKEVYETLARPVAPQVEGVDVVPSTALPDKVAGDQLVIKEEIVGGRTALTPAPSRDVAARRGDVFREIQVQATPSVQISLSESEGIPTGEEKLGAFVYRDIRRSMPPESVPAEEAGKLGDLQFDIIAKPKAKVIDHLALPSHEAPTFAPELPTGPAIARGEIVAKNGILIQGEMLQPPGSPVADKPVADVGVFKDQDLNMAFLGRAEQKRLLEKPSMASASVVISAAPGKARRVFGYYVSPRDLSQQSKVVERILRQNRGNVLSMQESKEEITITSTLPASAYRKFVDQLENKGFTIKREVPPKLVKRAREEDADVSKAGYRLYSQFRDDFRESRKLIQKREPTPELSRRMVEEKRRAIQVAPTPVIISEPSISITIIIQGTSPSPEATP